MTSNDPIPADSVYARLVAVGCAVLGAAAFAGIVAVDTGWRATVLLLAVALFGLVAALGTAGAISAA